MTMIAKMRQNGKAAFLMMGMAIVLHLVFSLPAFGQSLRERVVGARAESTFSKPEAGSLSAEFKRRLTTMRGYTVFDWLEARTNSNGEVVLRGQATSEAIKAKAEELADFIADGKKINNQIEVLPVSDNDKNLRKLLYRAVYNQNTALSRYADTTPAIHIVVKNGNVDLRGAVDSTTDSEMAFVAANAVPAVARVTNNLKVSSGLVATVSSYRGR